jgi:cytochrome-b5 reductase
MHQCLAPPCIPPFAPERLCRTLFRRHIFDMKVGEHLEMKGPFQKIEYTANMKSAIGMVAGGTGITPMYQVLTKILANPRDKTEVRLLFANETESGTMGR